MGSNYAPIAARILSTRGMSLSVTPSEIASGLFEIGDKETSFQAISEIGRVVDNGLITS